MKKLIALMFPCMLATMAQSQIVDVPAFEAKCNNFVASYNASPGSEITINYTDVLGKAVSAKIKTQALNVGCVTNSKQFTVVVGKNVGTYYEFGYVYEYNNEGIPVKLFSRESCTNTSVSQAYINVLKAAGVFVDQNVISAVQNMFSVSVCPAVDREIQAQIIRVAS